MGRLTIMIAATSVLLAVTRAESQTPRDSVVATVNEFFRAMTARGVKFRGAPRHEDYGTVAVFEDLYGNLWDLIEPSG